MNQLNPIELYLIDLQTLLPDFCIIQLNFNEYNIRKNLVQDHKKSDRSYGRPHTWPWLRLFAAKMPRTLHRSWSQIPSTRDSRQKVFARAGKNITIRELILFK